MHRPWTEAVMTLLGFSVSLVVFLALAVVLVSGLRIIPGAQSGLVIKRYGRPLPVGRIVALGGEAGYQAAMLSPGWHFGYWPWRFKVVKVPVTVVRAGEIVVVVAADGEAMPAERVLG